MRPDIHDKPSFFRLVRAFYTNASQEQSRDRSITADNMTDREKEIARLYTSDSEFYRTGRIKPSRCRQLPFNPEHVLSGQISFRCELLPQIFNGIDLATEVRADILRQYYESEHALLHDFLNGCKYDRKAAPHTIYGRCEGSPRVVNHSRIYAEYLLTD